MTKILWKYVYLHDLGPFQKYRKIDQNWMPFWPQKSVQKSNNGDQGRPRGRQVPIATTFGDGRGENRFLMKFRSAIGRRKNLKNRAL